MSQITKEQAQELFTKIGLNQKEVQAVSKNVQISENLLKILNHVKVNECAQKKGNLFYRVASLDQAYEKNYYILAEYIASEKINTKVQLEQAIEYIKKNNFSDSDINVKEFELAAGVGLTYTEADIIKEIQKLFAENQQELKTERYLIKGKLRLEAGKRLLFADGAMTEKIFNSELEKALGPLTEEDKQAALNKKKQPKVAEKLKQANQQASQEEEEITTKQDLNQFIKEARNIAGTVNSQKLLKEVQAITGGKLMTRFPPEPNGYLHIGHAKAIRFNFQTAKDHNGHCYLRYDDTNPDKETQEFIDNILANVRWFGYEPYKITYASEYFDKLYEFAVQLIKKGKAYVCNQKKVEMSEYRKEMKPSPYRERSIQENLQMFENMKLGLYQEGECMLRGKIDPAHKNPTMRDPVLYRIKYKSHPHVGNKWCIYPCYDFTHCISDSLEYITFSLCTLEFEIRRELYYWTLENLDLYRPYQYEYSRLNITNTILSKRKLTQLVDDKRVQGWDDPRMPTLMGLKRRGYSPQSIHDFIDSLRVTRRGNENTVSHKLLEHFIRHDLDERAQRTMTVIDPVKLVLTNVEENFSKTFPAPFFPKNMEKGTYDIQLKKYLYVDREDVRDVDHPKFFGFAPGKLVGLKYAGKVKVSEVLKNNEGVITEVRAEFLGDIQEKPKTFVHWISCDESVVCEVRQFDLLFSHEFPNELPNFLDGLNPNSLVVEKNARMHQRLLNLKVEESVQFERLGFYCVDKDTDFDKKHYVFNRTVTLKEGEKAKALKEIEQ